MKVDIRDAIAGKLPRVARYVPGFVYRGLERIVCQDDLNRILHENAQKTDWEFAAGVMRSMSITLRVEGEENIPQGRRLVFVSNHPLGGLDGIALLSILGRRYDNRVKCVVNDVLMLVEPLRGLFLPINKYGNQARQAMQRLDEAYAGDEQVVMFPAGLCSRMSDDGRVADLEWQKSFVAKSVESRRDVIPVFFDGENSRFFYKFARLRKRLGIRFNIELILLPREMVRAAGKTFTVRFGKPIPYTTFDGSRSAREWAAWVKNEVYGLISQKN